jgi:hypothetical protein
MRKQYHLRPSPAGLLAWDVHRLIALAQAYPVEFVPLAEIRELDEPFWYGEGSPAPTCREVAEHARLIAETDLAYPILLGADGRVMDGMHRVCKAWLCGHHEIAARRFPIDPPPDFTGIPADELPYDEPDA